MPGEGGDRMAAFDHMAEVVLYRFLDRVGLYLEAFRLVQLQFLCFR